MIFYRMQIVAWIYLDGISTSLAIKKICWQLMLLQTLYAPFIIGVFTSVKLTHAMSITQPHAVTDGGF